MLRRGLGLGLSLLSWATREECWTELDGLVESADWELRRAGVLGLGTAWLATGHVRPIRRLLRLKAQEMRAEVGCAVGISLGLILAGRGDQETALLEGLCRSHSHMERYGAVTGLGLAGAGSGSRRLLRLLASVLAEDS